MLHVPAELIIYFTYYNKLQPIKESHNSQLLTCTTAVFHNLFFATRSYDTLRTLVIVASCSRFSTVILIFWWCLNVLGTFCYNDIVTVMTKMVRWWLPVEAGLISRSCFGARQSAMLRQWICEALSAGRDEGRREAGRWMVLIPSHVVVWLPKVGVMSMNLSLSS